MLVAVDAGIHAALLGGLFGGLTVVLGIAVTEWLVRSRERREAVDAAADQLAFLLPKLLHPIDDQWTAEQPDTSWTSEWQTQLETTRRSLAIIQRKARWPLRHSGELRSAATDTATDTEFAVWLYQKYGRRPSREDVKRIIAGQPSLAAGGNPIVAEAVDQFTWERFDT